MVKIYHRYGQFVLVTPPVCLDGFRTFVVVKCIYSYRVDLHQEVAVAERLLVAEGSSGLHLVFERVSRTLCKICDGVKGFCRNDSPGANSNSRPATDLL